MDVLRDQVARFNALGAAFRERLGIPANLETMIADETEARRKAAEDTLHTLVAECRKVWE